MNRNTCLASPLLSCDRDTSRISYTLSVGIICHCQTELQRGHTEAGQQTLCLVLSYDELIYENTENAENRCRHSALCSDRVNTLAVLLTLQSQIETQNNKMTKLIFHNLKLNTRKLVHLLWINKYLIVLAVTLTVVSIRIFNYLWYLEIPKNEPSLLCSFGKGKYSEL